MKVIQLRNAVNDFASIDFSEIDMNAVVKEGRIDLIKEKQLTWNRNTGDNISDCPFYIGSIPIFDSDKLGDTFSDLNVKSAEFYVDGKSYTIIIAPQLAGSLINREASDMRTFRSGKIMYVRKYVFNPGYQYPVIFTPQEYALFTFCNMEMAKKLLACHFNELKFIECEIV